MINALIIILFFTVSIGAGIVYVYLLGLGIGDIEDFCDSFNPNEVYKYTRLNKFGAWFVVILGFVLSPFCGLIATIINLFFFERD